MKIKVKIISALLTQVVNKNGITHDHAGMGLLSERINEAIKEDFFNQKYLYYNIYKKVEALKDQPEEIIGLNANYLHKLAQYLGHIDFFDFRKTFLDGANGAHADQDGILSKPLNDTDKVWFSERRFGLFNIWRNPDIGELNKTDSGLLFNGERKELSIPKVDSFNSIAMAGDGDEYWIAVSFEDSQAPRTVYFANASDPLPNLNLGEIEPLYKLFQSL